MVGYDSVWFEPRDVIVKSTSKADAREMFARFRSRFWLPPRRHGEVLEDRSVSFLELFYDLVYVVLIARAAHTLAHHVSWEGALDFAIVFGLIWLAWLNGTLHHDLHGRNDGRSRTAIFIQMYLLVILAVFAGDATGEGGEGFAITYVALFVVFTWLWYAVRRQDTEEYMQVTARYLAGMGISILIMTVSIFASDDVRLLLWGLLVVGSIIGGSLLGRTTGGYGTTPTESMIERFGLFTIIVLGEVVVGVVDGLSEIERDLPSVATGILGLTIGFGFWWTYFDFVGGRLPGHHHARLPQWLYGHLPVTMAIAGAGAAMVSLLEHAGDARAPAAATWLLSSSVAILLLALILIMRTLDDFEALPQVYRPASFAMLGGAVASLLIGWLRPTPWILVLMLAIVQSMIWFYGIDRWLRYGGVDAAPIEMGG